MTPPRPAWAPPIARPIRGAARTSRVVVVRGASTSSLRAKRSNPESLRGRTLDCFVASLLAMTTRKLPSNCGARLVPELLEKHPQGVVRALDVRDQPAL